MKFGGLTWWRANYGSILQSYALQEYLTKEKRIDYEIICQYGKKNTSLKNLKDKIKNKGIRQTLKKLLFKFGIKNMRKRNNAMQKFVDTKLKVSKKEYTINSIDEANNIYDGFICGSDQIWNPTLSDLNSIYWLKFAKKDKIKIAYAPSIGVNKLNNSDAIKIKDNLKDFKAISCREKDGTELINSILESNKCKNVLDPTLLVEKETWDNLIKEEDNRINGDYIFVYILRGNKKQRQIIENIAKINKLKIVTMPFLETDHINLYDIVFGDIKIWDATPITFINLIKNAKYIFTDSFHCMIFSTIYHKKFLMFPKKGKAQMSRLINFQKMIGIDGVMIDEKYSIENINKILTLNNNWKKIDEIIRKKRDESVDFLDQALNK